MSRTIQDRDRGISVLLTSDCTLCSWSTIRVHFTLYSFLTTTYRDVLISFRENSTVDPLENVKSYTIDCSASSKDPVIYDLAFLCIYTYT